MNRSIEGEEEYQITNDQSTTYFIDEWKLVYIQQWKVLECKSSYNRIQIQSSYNKIQTNHNRIPTNQLVILRTLLETVTRKSNF